MPDSNVTAPLAVGPFSLPQSALFHYKTIDSEHQILVDILNGAVAAFSPGGHLDGTRFAAHVAQLLGHLRVHFANEEQAMAEAMYPDLATHRAHHAAIIDRLTAMRAEARPQKSIDREAVFELFDQVFNDLLRADLPFKAFLDARGLIKPE